ncbi:MAG: sigma-54-dependent Fis family transcriptional regulator [Nitrospinae bacterium]|nr:sigma-54-dependent Fis family transcriptional regulator [Nitrospinota bacterium]
MTAYGEVETAVSALKLGAYDYIKKPFLLDDMILVCEKALETVRLKREVQDLRGRYREEYGFDNIVGNSPPMKEVFEHIKNIATSDTSTILLRGESGTGKDLVAKTIHFQSSRFNKPFVEINCAAIPDTLLESELLGHERGAFTDARELKKGLFEKASGGTIFLDEIGNMNPIMQAKLLKIIEDKKVRRVGGLEDIEVNVRIIAATNLDLWSAVNKGNFREDLYYRLKIFPIYLPPLREHKEDIPLLIKYFLDRFNREFKKRIIGVSEEAIRLLMNYGWPGNVRELKNVIERGVIVGKGDTILPEHFPKEINSPDSSKREIFNLPPDGISLEDVERGFILQALIRRRGNKTQAARLLNISRDTLRYRMKKLNIEFKDIETG